MKGITKSPAYNDQPDVKRPISNTVAQIMTPKIKIHPAMASG